MIKYSHINYRFIAEQTSNYTFSDLLGVFLEVQSKIFFELRQEGMDLETIKQKISSALITQK